MDAFKDRFISALLGIMTFIVFQPFEFPSDWRHYPMMLAFMLVSVVGVLLSELIVTFVLKMPNDLSRGMKYIARRNTYFVPINISILTLAIATLFHVGDARPDVDYFSLDRLTYLVVCLICISVFQRLYWKNRYNAKILTLELCEAQRLNGILQERERQRAKKNLMNQRTEEAKERGVEEQGNRGTEEPMSRGSEELMSRGAEGTESQRVGEAIPNEAERSSDICITGSTKESIRLSADDLLFVESNGNYITVHYLKGEKVLKTEIRTSIKDVTELLSPYSSIMRCHRAFIVNLSNVISLERRTSGMELKMRSLAERIPVSKSYLQELKQRLQDPE